MDAEKIGKKVNGCVIVAVGLFLIILSLAALGVFGFDVLFGEMGAKTAEIAVDYSIPAVKNVIEPGARILWDEGSRAVKELLPDGPVTFGPVTIDPPWEDGVENTSEDGTADSSELGGGSPDDSSSAPVATATPIPCLANTPESLAALDAWKRGDWEVVAANINITQVNDCLARGFKKDYLDPFEIALTALQNADGEATIQAAAETTRRLNPAYPGTYSALAFVEANQWLTVKPLDVTQANLLAGSTVRIASVETDWDCAKYFGLCETDGDNFSVTIDFGEGWTAVYIFTREELGQLETALQLTAGGLTTVGNTVSVPGSLLPDPLPAVPAPAPDEYAAPTPPPSPTTGALCPAGKDISGLVVYDTSLQEWKTSDIFPSGAQTIGGGVGSDPATTLCHTTHTLPNGKMGYVANRDLR